MILLAWFLLLELPGPLETSASSNVNFRVDVGEQPMKNRGENLTASGEKRRKVKFEIFGEEMLEKEVKLSGNSGRVYLPPEWVGKHVKIIRTD